jgi:ribose 5-phosphate isomerase B
MIRVASDHAGFELKKRLPELLPSIQWEDLGPHNGDSVDYPDYAIKVAQAVADDEDAGRMPALGVLICGSGIGMCIAANKISGVRAAVAESPLAAQLAREHNHANVLCIGARLSTPEQAAGIIQAWLEATPSEAARHQVRIEKLAKLDGRRRKSP